MNIQMENLKKACDGLFWHLKDTGINEVEISEDLYWDIKSEDLYEVYTKPDDILIGSLCDNWEEMEKIAQDPDETTTHALVWLAAILRAVAIQQTKSS